MIVLHHLEQSRSHRIVWLLEEMGLEYEIKHYKRDPKTMLGSPELLKLHPLGKSPVITDGDITVAESGAIMEYLLDAHDDGSLRPAAGTDERRAFTYWLHYAEGSFTALLMIGLVMNRIETAKMPFFAKPIAMGIVKKVRAGYLDQNLQRHLGFIESTLKNQSWFSGETFSAADIQMSYGLEAVAVRTGLGDQFPAIGRFLETIRAREAYQRASESGGGFSIPGAK